MINEIDIEKEVIQTTTFRQKLNPMYWFRRFVQPAFRQISFYSGINLVWKITDVFIKVPKLINEEDADMVSSKTRKQQLLSIVLHILFIALPLLLILKKKWYVLPVVPILMAFNILVHLRGIYLAIMVYRSHARN